MIVYAVAGDNDSMRERAVRSNRCPRKLLCVLSGLVVVMYLDEMKFRLGPLEASLVGLSRAEQLFVIAERSTPSSHFLLRRSCTLTLTPLHAAGICPRSEAFISGVIFFIHVQSDGRTKRVFLLNSALGNEAGNFKRVALTTWLRTA